VETEAKGGEEKNEVQGRDGEQEGGEETGKDGDGQSGVLGKVQAAKSGGSGEAVSGDGATTEGVVTLQDLSRVHEGDQAHRGKGVVQGQGDSEEHSYDVDGESRRGETDQQSKAVDRHAGVEGAREDEGEQGKSGQGLQGIVIRAQGTIQVLRGWEEGIHEKILWRGVGAMRDAWDRGRKGHSR
jgi:hypothetical protein